MKVAVMMSTYNGARYLDEQIESLANQTIAQSVTLYIRDDGSKDATFDIIDSWKEKIHIERINGGNLGPAKSFWDLLTNQHIQADYYAFCDQDDVWDADKLEIAISHLTGNTHFYSCNSRLIDGEGAVIDDKYTKDQPDLTYPRLFVAGVVQGCAMVFTQELRQYILSRDIACLPMHDIILMLYAMSYGQIVYDFKPHFSYRVHSSNVVARENKSIFKKIRSTYWNWKNSGRNSMSTVAREMLQNCENLPDADKAFLTLMANYKVSLSAKWKLLFPAHTDPIPHRVLRSYRLRLLLNLL